MNKRHFVFFNLMVFFILSGSLFASDYSAEWYEEHGIVPASERVTSPVRGERILRDIPEGGLVLIPDSGPERVMAFDPITGDLIDANFIPSHSAHMTTPMHIIMDGEQSNLLMTDQSANVVHKLSFDGLYEGVFAPAGGANTAIMQNIRGMLLKENGNYLVSVAGGTNSHSVAEFDSEGNYLGNFIANGAGGIAGPWSILYRQSFDDYLLTTSTNGAIHRFGPTGQHIGTLVPTLSFPQQMYQMSNGNILVATFSNPSGVYEFDEDGVQIGFYNPVTGLRGVYELGNGNILTTNSSGVYEINRQGVLVDTKISGVNARLITFVGPGGAYGIPFEEDFESGELPEDWQEEQLQGSTEWDYQDGGHMGNPANAYEGDFNAFFRSDTIGDATILISPQLLIGNAINPMLRFQHAQAAWGTSQDELSVHYRIGVDGDWILLQTYDEDVPVWTEREIALPEPENDYYIGFKAESGGGYGICIDLVEVYDHVYPIMEVTPLEFDFVLIEGEETSGIVTISNVGTANLEFEIDFLEPADWLTLAEMSGTVTPGDSANVVLDIDTTELTGGENYSATIVVNDNYFDMEINVVINLAVEELILNPPLDLTAEVDMWYIALSWNEPEPRNRELFSRNLLGYNIYKDDVQQNTTLYTETNFVDDDIEQGLSFEYYVTAVYTEGESQPSNIIEVSVPYQVSTPAANPEGGYYDEIIAVELLCDTEDALIYYTLDGEDPDEEAILYEEPFILDEDTVVKAIAFKDGYFTSEIFETEYEIETTNVEQPDINAPITKLSSAYPNPFNPTTTISFSMAKKAEVTLEIFNVKGQMVKILLQDVRQEGQHSIIWHGRDSLGNNVGSGIYFYRMKTEDFVETKKMMLIQ